MLEIGYRLPARYLAPAPPEPPPAPAWREVWLGRVPDLMVLGTALAALTGVFFFQDGLARRRRLWARLRVAFLLFTLLWIGWYAAAQLSVVNVLTFGDALRTGFRWDFFLLEPLIFVLWSYVAVALIFWGRGVFCGWLCPFGALQELANRAARRLGVPQVKVPFWLHERLRALKFVIFLALFAVALGSMAQAQRLAEVEPFKTAIVLRFLRDWPFVAWALLLLAAGLFVERFFCRYLCPLGAALALPARLRQFEWLKRHRQCGRECRICEVQCPVQAIQPEGTIHPGECIYCLKCQCNYHDDHLCPPMIDRRRRAERRAALAAKPASRRSCVRPACPASGEQHVAISHGTPARQPRSQAAPARARTRGRGARASAALVRRGRRGAARTPARRRGRPPLRAQRHPVPQGRARDPLLRRARGLDPPVPRDPGRAGEHDRGLRSGRERGRGGGLRQRRLPGELQRGQPAPASSPCRPATSSSRSGSSPELALNLLGSMSRHLRRLVRQVEQLTNRSSLERLADFLLRLCPPGEPRAEIELPLDKVLVAARLGMQPETLSRSLARLRDAGVETRGSRIVVSDVAQLRRLAAQPPPAPPGTSGRAGSAGPRTRSAAHRLRLSPQQARRDHA